MQVPTRRAPARLGIAALLSLSAVPSLARAQGGPEEEPIPPSIPAAHEEASPAQTVTATPPPPRPAHSVGEPDGYLPSLMGPVGLYRMSTAEVGPANHLRFALHGEYFSASDFLVQHDSNSRLGGELTFGYTPERHVEVFGALLTSANRNQRDSSGEGGVRRDPEVIKSFGDLVLGSKAVLPIARGMTVGLELGLRFLSSVSGLSFSPDSTSLWVGPVYTLDLRSLANVPLRFHASANFYGDNSNNLSSQVFDVSDTKFTREVTMFAYGIAKSRFRFAAGVDAPLEKLTAPIPLQPFVEYHAEVVTSDADPFFLQQMPTPDNRDMQWLTFGLRARLYRGLTVDAGADVRLRSVGFPYGPPLPPWDLLFGAAYPLDIDSFTRPVLVTRTIEKTMPPPQPEEGRVAGAVKSGKDGKPVPGAIVAVHGRPRARVATDPDGTFQTVLLPPGPADLEISAPDYEPATVKTAVVVGRPVEVNVALTPKPVTGNVRGKVTDKQGHPVQAVLRFAGAETFQAQSDSTGLYSAALPVGPYKVVAEAPGLPAKEAPLDIAVGQDRQLDLTLRPPHPDLTITADAIELRQPIKFRGGASPKLDPKIEGELDGVAEWLTDHPEVRVLRVEAHWDNGGKAKDLTSKQASAVKEYLVKKGVPEGRVEAVGLGGERPLVPNIGPANKAKNHRVELHTVQ